MLNSCQMRLRNTMFSAPWTSEQVENLNRYQKSGVFHEFTCGGCDAGALIATQNGWHCTNCNYTQTTAHEFMLNFTQEVLEQHPFHAMYNKKSDHSK